MAVQWAGLRPRFGRRRPATIGAMTGDRVDLVGQVGDGEPVGFGGERDDGPKGGPSTGLVEIDTADTGTSGRRWLVQFVEDPVGDEGDVDAVNGGAELVEHPVSRSTMSPKRSRILPTLRYRVLWQTASKRSTCSPFV